MNDKTIFWIISLLACFSILFSFPEPAKSQKNEQVEYKVVRLLSDAIIPSTATISLGTVVIWVNESHEKAKIQFSNLNELASSCDGSTRFNTDMKQVISAEVPFAGLESICLIQKGEFNYIVKRGSHKLEGKIIIK